MDKNNNLKGLPKQFHTSNQKVVSGDFKGTAIKNPIGKIRDVYAVDYATPKGTGKPPKSLA